jgi:hypothetical protein
MLYENENGISCIENFFEKKRSTSIFRKKTDLKKIHDIRIIKTGLGKAWIFS